jgi:hypothetical protein
MLINKLSVDDARHLLKSEGGEITAAQLVLQIAAALFVAALTARAIVVGNATVWHLALPLVAQYMALIVALPFVQLLARHPDLNKDSLQALRLWLLLALALGIVEGVRSYQQHVAWQDLLAADVRRFWKWIVDAHMQWPIIIAFVGMVLSIPGRVRNLFEHGPPFVGVSLGCAMQFVVLFLGAFTLPWALSNRANPAWFLWAVLLLAELLALWMHWDIQTRLKKIDAET